MTKLLRAIVIAPWRGGVWVLRALAAMVMWLCRPFYRAGRVVGRWLSPVTRPLARGTWWLIGPPVRLIGRAVWGLARPTIRAVAGRLAPAPKVLQPYTADPQSMVRGLRRTIVILLIAMFCFVYGAAFALLAQGLMTLFFVPPVLLLLAVIWGLPDMPRAPTKLLARLFMAYFIILVIWPNYLALALPGLPWITSQRLTSFPMMAIFLICLSVSASFRKDLGRSLAATPLIWRVLAVFVMLQTVSLAFSSTVSFSIQKYIVDQIGWTSVYLIGCWVFLTPGRLMFWAKAMWIMGLIETGIALVEAQQGHAPWAGHIPSFLSVPDPSVQRILAGTVRAASGEHRAMATFSTPLGLGEYIALAMPFALHFLATTKDWRIRLLALISVPLFITDGVLADSRLGIVGCLMSVVLSLFGHAYFRWRRQPTNILAPAIVLSYPAIALGIFAAIMSIGKLRRRILGGGEAQASNDSRVLQWQMGFPKIEKHPWGYGLGRAAETLGFYAPGFDFVTIDSYYLSLLLEYGPLGFVIYWTMIIGALGSAAIWGIGKNSDDEEHALLVPLAIALLNFVVVKSVFSQEDNHPLAFMLMAGVTALIYRAKQQPAPARRTALVDNGVRPHAPLPTPALGGVPSRPKIAVGNHG